MKAELINRLSEGVVTQSSEHTRELGCALSRELPESAIVALYGDLGVGKSVFVSGLARGWGIGQPTVSPTFNLFHVYEGERRLIHLDAYRLDDARQMDALMLEDFMLPPFCLVVEWAVKIEAWLPEDCLKLELGIVQPGQHRIQLMK